MLYIAATTVKVVKIIYDFSFFFVKNGLFIEIINTKILKNCLLNIGLHCCVKRIIV